MNTKIYIGEGGDFDGAIIEMDIYYNTFTTFIQFSDGKQGYISLPSYLISLGGTSLIYIGEL